MTTTKAAAGVGAGLPRKFLRPLLFLGMSRTDRSYGYELAEAVRGYGLSIDMAGIYRELRSMEQRDLLDSSWEPSETGPDRRVYELTDAGREASEVAVADLRQARDLLTAALDSTFPDNDVQAGRPRWPGNGITAS